MKFCCQLHSLPQLLAVMELRHHLDWHRLAPSLHAGSMLAAGSGFGAGGGAGVSDALAAALSTDLAAQVGGSPPRRTAVVAPWQPKGILVRRFNFCCSIIGLLQLIPSIASFPDCVVSCLFQPQFNDGVWPVPFADWPLCRALESSQCCGCGRERLLLRVSIR